MGKAGKALKQVLETHNITSYRLAKVMGVSRSNMHRWINEAADPSADAVLDIRDALKAIDPTAAEAFTALYWNSSPEDAV